MKSKQLNYSFKGRYMNRLGILLLSRSNSYNWNTNIACIMYKYNIHYYIIYTGPLRGGSSRGGAAGPITNKQVENCFLNHNSSIIFCCTNSLLMTHRGGLSLSIIIWRIGGGKTSFLVPWGPKIVFPALNIYKVF